MTGVRSERQVLLNDCCPRRSDGVGLVLGRGLDHVAHEWLGTRGTQEHATGVAQASLSGRHGLGDGLIRRRGRAVHAAHVDEGLRQALDEGRQVGQRTAGLLDHARDQERGQNAVAGGRVIAGDDVAGLLAAEAVAGCQHLLEHVAVAHAGLHGVDASLAHGNQQTQVAHDSDDERVLGECPARLSVDGQRTHDLVAVDEVALVVDGQAAVRIAVVRHTEIAAGLDDGGLQGLGVGRTRVQVDVAPIRGRVDDGDVSSELAEDRRAQLGGRAVRAVDRDLHAAQVRADRANKVGNVGVLGPRMIGVDLADAVTGGAIPLGVQEGLDLILDAIRELVAAVREELNAVIGHRVMRRGNHDAEVHGVLGSGQMRDRRRGDDADTGHVHAGAGQARREGVIKELARNTRVASDDRARLRTVRASGSAELAGGRLAELQRKVRSDINVRQSSHAIRAEHPGHSLSVQWVV